jgi:cell division transport system permease protein
MKTASPLTWLPRYVLSLLAYCFRWWRGRLLAWLATALAVGAVLALAASSELFLVLAERSLTQQARSASEFQVFLADDATSEQVDALSQKISALPGVRNVSYRSKAEAMRRASQDPALKNVGAGSSDNPFPASLVVQLTVPSAAGQVAAVAEGDPAADRNVPVSYTPAEGERLSAFLSTAQALVVGIAVGALTIASLVALVLLRGEIRARRQELRILALLGTPRRVIRLPVLLEAVSLAVAGSAVAIAALFYVGGHVVPAVNTSLPFLHLGSTAYAIQVLSVATLASSVLALGVCSWLVRLPR